MSESLRGIMEMNVFDAQKQEWLKGAPETVDAAVYRADGTTVKEALDAIPTAIDAAVSAVKGGVAVDGDTLAKVYSKVLSIQLLLDSDDIDLDTLQEVVDYIKDNRDALELLGGDKLDKSAVTDALDVITEGQALDAKAGKVLNDLIAALQTAVSGLQTQAGSFATTTALQTQASNNAATYATKTELQAVEDSAATKTELQTQASNNAATYATKTELQAVESSAATKTELQAQASNNTATYATKTELQTVESSAATKTELQAVANVSATKDELAAVATAAIPVVSETPPADPVDGQMWFKPIGAVEV